MKNLKKTIELDSFLITADLHIEKSIFAKKVNMMKLIDHIQDLVTKNKIKAVIFAGDTTHKPNLPVSSDAYKSLIMLFDFLVKLKREQGVDNIFLKGTPGHDGNNIKDIVSESEAYKTINYIEESKLMTISNTRFLFLTEPHFKSHKEFEDDVLRIKGNEEIDVCVFHGEFDYVYGSNVDNNTIATSIRMSSDFMQRQCRICIGGHIHDGANKGNIYYAKQIVKELKDEYESNCKSGFNILTVGYGPDGGASVEMIPNELNEKYMIIEIDMSQRVELPRIYKQIEIEGMSSDSAKILFVLDYRPVINNTDDLGMCYTENEFTITTKFPNAKITKKQLHNVKQISDLKLLASEAAGLSSNIKGDDHSFDFGRYKAGALALPGIAGNPEAEEFISKLIDETFEQIEENNKKNYSDGD